MQPLPETAVAFFSENLLANRTRPRPTRHENADAPVHRGGVCFSTLGGDCSGGCCFLCGRLVLGFRDGAQQPLHRAIPALAWDQQKLALADGGYQAILCGPIALRAAQLDLRPGNRHGKSADEPCG